MVSVLSRPDIRDALALGELAIEPYHAANVQPASVDLHLGPSFRAFKEGLRFTSVGWDEDLDEHSYLVKRQIGTPYHLPPWGFVLAVTHERIEIGPALIARIEGRSSIGRRGLFVHVTAGFIDPGFRGWPTLEIFNASPMVIPLWPMQPIAQLAIERLSTPVTDGYNGRYQDSPQEPISSRLRWYGVRGGGVA